MACSRYYFGVHEVGTTGHWNASIVTHPLRILLSNIKDYVPTFRIYVLFYWFDLLVSLLMTALLSVVWFVFTDRSTDLATQGTGADEKELDEAWRMEGLLSVAMLTIMWGVRVYFATVLWRYYHILLNRQHLYPSSNAGSSFGLSSQGDGFDDVEEDLDFMDNLEARRGGYLKVDV
ncbi:hypothetical protein BC936DRAFT_146303 [Jimgerdemannia flammicorona]|uniref:Uncharacterized protein n=1 Tax=Jimgerdemannia flammicorona TaxID=994334 RepID=A0A433DLI1_9FUNG|nr:hypothetical protein BC936DRAFT_146303 [Jimgerdemannia flammicorona]